VSVASRMETVFTRAWQMKLTPLARPFALHSFGCIATGFLCALIGWGYGHAIGVDTEYLLFMFIAGFIAGFAMTQVTLNVISSAVATVFVCFAENPQSLQQIHPQDSAKLVSAWRQFHGDVQLYV